MVRPSTSASLASMAVMAMVACSAPTTDQLQPHPPLQKLTTMATIPGSLVYPTADAVGLDNCRVLIADEGGHITLVAADGEVGRVDTVPENRALHFEMVDSGGLIAWANSPAWMARIQLNPFKVDSQVVPQHAWGGAYLGPAVELGDLVATAPLANPTRARRGGQGAAPAPLIELIDAYGVRTSTAGPALVASDDYHAWRTWHGELGRIGDTLLFVSFSDGILHKFLANSSASLSDLDLPQYFRSVEPRVEVLEFPWIQFGHFPFFMDTPQIQLATFGYDGRLYAVRPYSYKWSSRPNKYVRRSGTWEPTSIGLEIYSTKGELLGAYSIPPGVRTIHASRHGQIVMVIDNEVVIARNPTAGESSCAYSAEVVMALDDNHT